MTTISTSGGHIAEVTGTGYNARGDVQLRAYKGRDLDVARMGVQSMLEVSIICFLMSFIVINISCLLTMFYCIFQAFKRSFI